MTSAFDIKDRSEFLFVPMQPTPNGRLHIGHGAGPYLRADVLARRYRRDGHNVRVVTGSDAYENWVEPAAATEGGPVVDFCRRNHDGIGRDLAFLDASPDIWIDPTADQHRDGYTSIHEKLLAELVASGCVQSEPERILFDPNGQAIVGPWLLGRCPNCGASCGGNTCVACGLHFQPEEIIEPRARSGVSDLRWNTVENLFLTPSNPLAIRRAIESSGLPDWVMRSAVTYLETRGGRIRLSNVGQWGVQSTLVPRGHVLSNTYYAYSLYCGLAWSNFDMMQSHPFERTSDVVTVGFFGIDNLVAGAVAPQVLSYDSISFRAFDHTIVNGMLHFEGEKCSTSKRHGIWIGEVAEKALLRPDELRIALGRKTLDLGVASIDIPEFSQVVGIWRTIALERLEEAHGNAGTTWDGSLLNQIEAEVRCQRSYLSVESVRLDLAFAAFEEFVFDNRIDLSDPAKAATWLFGFSFIGEPIVPALSLWARKAIGIASLTWAQALIRGPAPSKSISLPRLPTPPLLEPFVRRHSYSGK